MTHCTVAGCTAPLIAKGLCGMHYNRLRRHGGVEVKLRVGPKPKPGGEYEQREAMKTELESLRRAILLMTEERDGLRKAEAKAQREIERLTEENTALLAKLKRQKTKAKKPGQMRARRDQRTIRYLRAGGLRRGAGFETS